MCVSPISVPDELHISMQGGVFLHAGGPFQGGGPLQGGGQGCIYEWAPSISRVTLFDMEGGCGGGMSRSRTQIHTHSHTYTCRGRKCDMEGAWCGYD